MKRLLALGFILPFLLIGSFFLNVAIHEYGHYAVADHYGLNPEIHFSAISQDTEGIALYGPSAYTSYSSSSRDFTPQDGIIALAGPLINLGFALAICGVYLAIPKQKRTFPVQACFAMMLVPSFLSFIINMLPIGASDGAIVLASFL